MPDERKTKKQLVDELNLLRRRVAELEASQSRESREEELFRILRASSPVGLFIAQDNVYVFVNDEFCRYTGFTAEELIGDDVMKVVYPADVEQLRNNALKMIRGELTAPYRYRLMDKAGQVKWMLEGVALVQFQGRPAVLGHSVDITEAERAEAKLARAYEEERKLRQELEAEVQRRVEFTRALVHELKTPLTPVLASSELLVSELHDEPWLSVAKNIYHGAANLSRRIDELLDLAKGEIGILQVNPRPVNALNSLQSIAENVAVMIRNNRQKFDVALPPYLPLVWADEERLRQVVLNLLVNATKFTPEGGRVTLKASAQDGNLVVEVKDTGPGIPEESQKRLFHPYQRSIADREHLSGLGLGLALCKNLVELHGGRIWVKSKVGEGSTFGFSLPLVTISQQEDPFISWDE